MKSATCDDEANIRAYLSSLIRAQSCPCEIVKNTSAKDCLTDIRRLKHEMRRHLTNIKGLAAPYISPFSGVYETGRIS